MLESDKYFATKLQIFAQKLQVFTKKLQVFNMITTTLNKQQFRVWFWNRSSLSQQFNRNLLASLNNAIFKVWDGIWIVLIDEVF